MSKTNTIVGFLCGLVLWLFAGAVYGQTQEKKKAQKATSRPTARRTPPSSRPAPRTTPATTPKAHTAGPPVRKADKPTARKADKPAAPKAKKGVWHQDFEKAEGSLITEIYIKGLRFLTPSKIRSLLFLQKSGNFSARVVQWDIRRLRKTKFFSKIEAHIKDDNGLVELRFTLQERGTWIRALYFVGHRLFNAAQLMQMITMRAKTPFVRRDLATNARKIIKQYHTLGYFRVQVTVQGDWVKHKVNGKWVKKTKPAELKLWFVIKEGGPAKVRRVRIKGNHKVPTQTLLKLLDSKPPTIFSGVTGAGTYHPSFVARDLYFLRNYYYDNGFLQSQVTGPRLEVSRDRRWVSLVYTVTEGPKYRYGKVFFVGDLIVPKERLRRFVTLKAGQVFNRSSLYKDNILPMLHFYQERGYAYATIRPVPVIDPVTQEINLRFYIRKGIQWRIGRVDVDGALESKDWLLRRELQLKPGDLYNVKKLRLSQRRLFALGFFLPTDRRYGVRVLTTKSTKQPGHIDLRFVLREKNTWIYPIPSFGVIPDYGLVIGAALGKSNFLGMGQTLYARGLISTSGRFWNIYGSFIEPRLFGTNLTVSASIFRSYEEPSIAGFARDNFWGSLSLSHPAGPRWLRVGLRYRGGQSDLTVSGERDRFRKIEGYEGSWRISSLRVSLQVGGRQFRLTPYLRTWNSFSLEHAARYFGADYNLFRLEGISRWYLDLPYTLSLRAAVTVGSLLQARQDVIPTIERYFLGGIYSMRGYPLLSISPTRVIAASSDAAFRRGSLFWGGDKKLMVNLEFSFPLWNALKLRGVVFYDAGNVYDSGAAFFQDLQNTKLPLGLYMNIGFGVRWVVPNLGVMRFEWGIPLTPRAGIDLPIIFGFTIGESIF